MSSPTLLPYDGTCCCGVFNTALDKHLVDLVRRGISDQVIFIESITLNDVVWVLGLFETPYQCWDLRSGRSHLCHAVLFNQYDTPLGPRWEVWHTSSHALALDLMDRIRSDTLSTPSPDIGEE
jgi:hypothetical protein